MMEYFEKLMTLRILFVDDNAFLCQSMTHYFRNKVASFVTALNAEDALGRLKEQVFDVVICDYRLPGMDGLQFFEEMAGKFSAVRKILITAYGDKGLENRAREIGIGAVIPKPFDGKQIEAAMVQ